MPPMQVYQKSGYRPNLAYNIALCHYRLGQYASSLKSIADESYITLMKSAFSTNIKERHDHSTAITNSDGKLIAQAENALPAHLASMGGLIQHVLY